MRNPIQSSHKIMSPQHACLQVALGIAEGNPQAALLPPAK